MQLEYARVTASTQAPGLLRPAQMARSRVRMRSQRSLWKAMPTFGGITTGGFSGGAFDSEVPVALVVAVVVVFGVSGACPEIDTAATKSQSR